MKKLTNSGFGLIEGLIVAGVVVVLGVGGYFIYSQNKSTEDRKEDTTSDEQSDDDALKGETLEIAALGVGVEDPDNRELTLTEEKVASPFDESEETWYMISSSDNPNFEGCGYPAAISSSTEAEADSDNDSYVQVEDKWFYVFAGTNFQAPCAPEGVEDVEFTNYSEELRTYIKANLTLL